MGERTPASLSLSLSPTSDCLYYVTCTHLTSAGRSLARKLLRYMDVGETLVDGATVLVCILIPTSLWPGGRRKYPWPLAQRLTVPLRSRAPPGIDFEKLSNIPPGWAAGSKIFPPCITPCAAGVWKKCKKKFKSISNRDGELLCLLTCVVNGWPWEIERASWPSISLMCVHNWWYILGELSRNLHAARAAHQNNTLLE